MLTQSARLSNLAESVTELQNDLDAITEAVGDLKTELNHLGHDLHNIIGEIDNLLLTDEEPAVHKAGSSDR